MSSKPVRKLDLLRDCNDQGIPPADFMGTFCQRCRNPECVNAGWAGSSWSGRMATQVDRLLTFPSFANPDDPRFERLRDLEFRQVEAPIVWNPSDPWAGPSVHLVDPERKTSHSQDVEEAIKSLAETRVKKAPESPGNPVPETRPEPSPQPSPVQAPVAERTSAPKHYVLDTLPAVPQVQAPTPTQRVVNTPFPEEGVMLDGGPLPTPQVKEEIDPWAIKPGGDAVKVPVGARVRMGGNPKK